MMTVFVNTLKKPDHFDVFVGKFRSLCDMHRVRFGSPDDLPDFMEKLVEDRHFAMDFWAFTGKLSSREGGSLSDEEMLTVVVGGIADGDVPETDGRVQRVVEDLAKLLAGVDVHSPTGESYSEPAPFPPQEARPVWQASPGDTVRRPVRDRPVERPLYGRRRPVESESRRYPSASAPERPISRQPAAKTAPLTEAAASRQGFVDAAPVPEGKAAAAPQLKDEPASRAKAAPALKAKAVPFGKTQNAPPVSNTASSAKAEAPIPQAEPAPSPQSSAQAAALPPQLDEALSALERNRLELKQHLQELDSRMNRLDPEAEALSQRAVPAASPQPHPSEALSLPPQLDEALSRLEMNSLELKQHLQELDSRMSRLEPHLEELTSIVSSKKQEPPPVQEPFADAIEELARKRAEVARLVGEPVVMHRGESPASMDDDDPSIAVPLEHYSAPQVSRGVVLIMLFVVVAIGGILVQTYSGPFREGYNTLLQKMHGGSAVKDGAAPADQSAPGNDATGPGSSVAPPAGAIGSSTSAASPATSRRPAPLTGTSVPQTMDVASGRSPAAASRREAEAARRALASHSAGASIADATGGNELSNANDGIGAINVPPSVMEANLLLSRVPAYPPLAKADGIQGPVVLKAIISKSGTVDRVSVLQGDPLLRGAATEAVQKRRYRPYLLNGEPVDVATTITVDFKLGR